MNNQNEIIPGYCDRCRSYERNNYGEVLSKMNKNHFTACKDSNCLHPVFYIADRVERIMIPFRVNAIQQMMTDDPELSLDVF